ncbi:hypothetical protein BVG19_g5056 [[Candida] boidinii]|nr:hypothetical protein BVG19_g5056 [[Candida] boidinii]OWB52560.1 hypothetical protein B5S27_g4137 [[Candida] boidinii]OWB85622.1 hypothetical protein B5S33_g4291 [[Candida] boidinii]
MSLLRIARTQINVIPTRSLLLKSCFSSNLSISKRFNSTNKENKLNPESIVSTYSQGPITIKYTQEHEWLSFHPDGTTFVGITQYAADALGDATFIELPTDLVGESISKGDTIGSVESVKSASEIYSPVDGEILEVNEELESNPGLINEDAMGNGWIAKIKVAELDSEELLNEEDYKKLLEEHED